MVVIAEEIKQKSRLSLNAVCLALDVPYSSLRRWRTRAKANEALLQPPGPKKTAPLDLERMRADLGKLGHRQKRSFGTSDLYGRYAQGISRRKFQELVKMARYDAILDHRCNLRRIQWLIPNLVWAGDDTEYEERDVDGKKLFVHNTRDLASRYQLKPLGGDFACGQEIAAHLDNQFKRHGAPLFYKRDTGGNLNHGGVDEVLAAYGVIPLNSPTYYAPYNGAVEKSQGELKGCIHEKLDCRGPVAKRHFEAYAEAAAHDLNHRPKRSLNGKTPCQVFTLGKDRARFTQKERRRIYEWIVDLRNRILESMENPNQKAANAAWRIAAEAWLHKNGFISITINGKSVTPFSADLCS